MKRVSKWVILGFLLGCSGGNSRQLPPGSFNISALDGGTVQSEDGLVTLTIPPGALEDNTVISIKKAATIPSNARGLSDVYEFGPDGTQFLQPAVLTMKTNPATLGGVNEETLTLSLFGDNGEKIPLGGVVDTVNHTVTAEIPHFTDGEVESCMPNPAIPFDTGYSLRLEVEGNGVVYGHNSNDSTIALSCNPNSPCTLPFGVIGPNQGVTLQAQANGNDYLNAWTGDCVDIATGTVGSDSTSPGGCLNCRVVFSDLATDRTDFQIRVRASDASQTGRGTAAVTRLMRNQFRGSSLNCQTTPSGSASTDCNGGSYSSRPFVTYLELSATPFDTSSTFDRWECDAQARVGAASGIFYAQGGTGEGRISHSSTVQIAMSNTERTCTAYFSAASGNTSGGTTTGGSTSGGTLTDCFPAPDDACRRPTCCQEHTDCSLDGTMLCGARPVGRGGKQCILNVLPATGRCTTHEGCRNACSMGQCNTVPGFCENIYCRDEADASTVLNNTPVDPQNPTAGYRTGICY